MKQLFALTNVSRTFHDTITGSSKLQHAMFLGNTTTEEDQEHEIEAIINPLLRGRVFASNNNRIYWNVDRDESDDQPFVRCAINHEAKFDAYWSSNPGRGGPAFYNENPPFAADGFSHPGIWMWTGLSTRAQEILIVAEFFGYSHPTQHHQVVWTAEFSIPGDAALGELASMLMTMNMKLKSGEYEEKLSQTYGLEPLRTTLNECEIELTRTRRFDWGWW